MLILARQRSGLPKEQLEIDQISPVEITGVLRTDGLGQEERQNWSLTEARYQITDFTNNQEADLYGYYLIGHRVEEELLGKCVRISGHLPQEWEKRNKADTYLRSALIMEKIERLNFSDCNPYPALPPIEGTLEELTLEGTVIHSPRPAPDINYDYQLKLTQPFTDKYSATGAPQPTDLVDINPTTNEVWRILEENLDREISLQGYMVWGYAESRFLEVIQATPKLGAN